MGAAAVSWAGMRCEPSNCAAVHLNHYKERRRHPLQPATFTPHEHPRLVCQVAHHSSTLSGKHQGSMPRGTPARPAAALSGPFPSPR